MKLKLASYVASISHGLAAFAFDVPTAHAPHIRFNGSVIIAAVVLDQLQRQMQRRAALQAQIG